MTAFTVTLGIVVTGLLPYLPIKTLVQALLCCRPRLYPLPEPETAPDGSRRAGGDADGSLVVPVPKGRKWAKERQQQAKWTGIDSRPRIHQASTVMEVPANQTQDEAAPGPPPIDAKP